MNGTPLIGKLRFSPLPTFDPASCPPCQVGLCDDCTQQSCTCQWCHEAKA